MQRSRASRTAAELLRARLRWLFSGAQEEPEEAGRRSGPPGARGDAQSGVRGVGGQASAPAGADREDRRADRRLPGCTGSRTMRSG